MNANVHTRAEGVGGVGSWARRPRDQAPNAKGGGGSVPGCGRQAGEVRAGVLMWPCGRPISGGPWVTWELLCLLPRSIRLDLMTFAGGLIYFACLSFDQCFNKLLSLGLLRKIENKTRAKNVHFRGFFSFIQSGLFFHLLTTVRDC